MGADAGTFIPVCAVSRLYPAPSLPPVSSVPGFSSGSSGIPRPIQLRYLQQGDDAVLRVLVRADVEHSGPVAVHDPVVHLCVGADVRVRRFNGRHHGARGQRLRHGELVAF